jgi:hypothetical protein
MNKNKICQYELQRKINLQDIWYLTHKYSKVFKKNINKEKLSEIILNSYKEYENECKSNNHHVTNKLKNNRIWNTLINTCKNPKNDMKTIRGATNVFIHSININLKNYNINRL